MGGSKRAGVLADPFEGEFNVFHGDVVYDDVLDDFFEFLSNQLLNPGACFVFDLFEECFSWVKFR